MEKFNSNEFCYHVFALLNVGITVREALQRQIDYCNLSPNDPILFQYGDPYKRPIPWDSEISQIGSGSAKLTLGVELEDNSKRPKTEASNTDDIEKKILFAESGFTLFYFTVFLAFCITYWLSILAVDV